jgi:MerR family transcriptional regulator, light-induced transcriptional regulator
VSRSAKGAPEPAAADLMTAAFALDTITMEEVLERSLSGRGVLETWQKLVMPTFTAISEQQAASGKCIDVEHAFSWIVSRSLQRFATVAAPRRDAVPLVLACMERETHTLALEALYAALAEHRRPTLMLGASVPVSAVLDALAHQAQRAAVMLWAQSSATADRKVLDTVRAAACYVIVGGPGWRGVSVPRATLRVTTLPAALEAVIAGI